MKHACLTILAAVLLVAGGCSSTGPVCFKGHCAAPAKDAAASAPGATNWSGTWTDTRMKDHGGDLHCTAVPTGDNTWKARFFGNCGREYSYEIDMTGKAEGERIVFSGTVDLGEKDGGVYTWTGAIDGDKFNGEYSTAQGKAGVFAMTKQP